MINIACTISSAILTDCWRPRQENFFPSAAFVFKKDSESVENIWNLARLGKNEMNLTFFQVRNIDIWNKMRNATEIIGIGILIKELEEIKVWIEIKLLIELK